MGVKLSGKLPKGDRSGLDLLHGELVKDPTQGHYVIAMVDSTTVKVDHGVDGDTYTPTANILMIEPILDAEGIEILQELLGSAKARRLGGGQAAFPLDGGES